MNNDSIQADAASTDGLDLDTIPETASDPKIDSMFEEWLQDESLPDEVPEQSTDKVEIAEVEETPADDDSVIETPDEEEVEAETAQDESDTEASEDTGEGLDFVDYEEAKKFKFPIKNSKTGEVEYRTIDQINAEVNRSRTQQETLKEVDTRQEELDRREASLDQSDFALQQRQAVAQGQEILSRIDSQLEQVDKAAQEAFSVYNSPQATETQKRKATERLTVLNTQKSKVEGDRRRIERQVEESLQSINVSYGEAAVAALAEMSKYGVEDFSKDSQRKTLFVDYVEANLPASLHTTINSNGALMAMIEKARMYDKTKATVKPKLRGNAKSQRGGAIKPAPKKEPVDKMQSKIDRMFGG